MKTSITMEEWRDIPGWEGYYQASNFGRIKSLARMVLNKKYKGLMSVRERLLKQVKGGRKDNERYTVCLARDGTRVNRDVHLLILEAFVGLRPKNLVACHNDGDRLSNTLQNLRWDTPESNYQDRDNHGTTARGERSGVARLTDSKVVEIREKSLTGKYLQRELAAEYEVCESTIRAVITNKIWQHV